MLLSKISKAKLNAYALPYTVMVGLVIFVILGGLILLSYLNGQYIYRLLNRTQYRSNVNSGINLLLADRTVVGKDAKKVLSLFQEGGDSVLLQRTEWGVFEVIAASVVHGYEKYQKIAMIGDVLNKDNAVSLYLSDQNKPLSLCGKVEINGLCYLPEAGVKRAYIEGKSFTGDKLINGVTKKSENKVPELPKDISHLSVKELKSKFLSVDSLITYMDKATLGNLSNSYINKTKILYSIDKISLGSSQLLGNIVVISAKSVEISSNAKLENIVICAPYIKVDDGFIGKIQLFANDSIVVGKNCEFKFPSALGIVNNDITSWASQIKIDEKTIVNGFVFLYKSTISRDNTPVLRIASQTKIKGQAWTNGMVELKGEIWGSLYCSSFILNTPSSIYENHLMDITIDQSKLSPYYVAVNIEKQTDIRRVIAWLY